MYLVYLSADHSQYLTVVILEQSYHCTQPIFVPICFKFSPLLDSTKNGTPDSTQDGTPDGTQDGIQNQATYGTPDGTLDRHLDCSLNGIPRLHTPEGTSDGT